LRCVGRVSDLNAVVEDDPVDVVDDPGFVAELHRLGQPQRDSVQLPAPALVVVEDGESALGVVGNGLGPGLGSNSASTAASVRLICWLSSASRAMLDVAAVWAAFTVSLPTDSLATFRTDVPASIICWMPRARWALDRSCFWSLVTIWCTMRSIVPAAVSAAVAAKT
jgi:hypothetical protein